MAKSKPYNREETDEVEKAPKAAKAPKAPKPPKAEVESEGEAKTRLIDRSRYHYEKAEGVKTKSGRPVFDSGDALAVALRGKSAEEVIALVEANGAQPSPRWSSLNAGMQRMNAGNVLRRLAKRPEGVEIDGTVIRLGDESAAA